jgi:hypothetical protein
MNLLLYAFGLLPVTWAALLFAPYLHGGLLEILKNLSAAMNDPLHIVWCEDSLKTSSFLLPPMQWASVFICPPSAITATGRSTAPPGGAMRKRSAEDTGLQSPPTTSF